MKDQLSVLLFGYGSMGRRRAAVVKDAGHLLAVRDPGVRGDYAHHMAHVPFFETDEAAWGWQPDAVIVSTPADLHAHLFWRAVEHGLPVLVEKPLSTRVAMLGADAETLASVGTVVQVGYQLRHHAHVAEVREALRGLDAETWSRLRGDFSVTCDRATWPGRGYADTLLECSHELDLALHLLGPARARHVECFKGAWTVQLRHASGARSVVRLDDRADGRAYWRWGRVVVGGGFAPPTVGGWDWRGAVPDLEACYVAETRAFLSAAASGVPCPVSCDLAGGLSTLRLCDAVRASAEPKPTRNTQ